MSKAGEVKSEMTLAEWCLQLPKFHLVNKELRKLENENKKLRAALQKILTNHTNTQNHRQGTTTHICEQALKGGE